MHTEKHDHYINEAAYQYFRDVADGDYIMARCAFASLLAPQFFYYTQQALEKYMKCILVLQRIDTKKFSHNLTALLRAVQEQPDFLLSTRTTNSIKKLHSIQVRYLETSYTIDGTECAGLDKAVWELRRYCVAKSSLPAQDNIFLTLDLNDSDTIKALVARTITGSDFCIPNGKLEKILADANHPARANLVTNNPFYGEIRSPKVFGTHCYWENTLLHAFNDEALYNDLAKYIKMPARDDFFTTTKIDNIVSSQRLEFAESENSAERAELLRQNLLLKAFPAEQSADQAQGQKGL